MMPDCEGEIRKNITEGETRKNITEPENRANNSNAIVNFSSLYLIDYRIAEQCFFVTHCTEVSDI